MPDNIAFAWSRACTVVPRSTNKGPKVFPEALAWSAARRRLQQELILLRQRSAESTARLAKTAARRAAVIEARSLAARRPWEVASSACVR
jgi:hypothetical protein